MSLRSKISQKGKQVRQERTTRLRPAAVMHVIFNIIVALLVYLLVVKWSMTVVAVILVLLSKWRVIGVRPRFWWANLRTNLPDIIVGLSTVAWLSTDISSVTAVIVAIVYLVWLLILKPRTSTFGMMMQAGWSTLIGLNVVFVILADTQPAISLILVWVIVWSNARHFLSIFEDEDSPIIAVAWALVVSQLAWLALQWVVLFRLPGELLVSQFALMILVLSYGLGGWYGASHSEDNQHISNRSLWLRYGIFTIGALVLIIIFTPWSGGV